MAGPMPGLLTLMEELYGRINKERLFGGGVRGAATRGLLGAQPAEDMTPTQRDVYENAVRISAPAQGLTALKAATVFHGSPAKFKRFDPTKIGSGEGAQAYGYGHYVAENPSVAKGYQQAVSKDKLITAGGYFDPAELEHLNVRAAMRGGDLDKAINLASQYGKPDSDYPETAAKAARDLARLEAIKQSGGAQTNPGAFYKIDLPDEQIARMLDWDKPLSQQPEIVKSISPQSLGLTYKKLENGNHAFVNSEGQIIGNLQKGGTQESFTKNWTEDVLRGTGSDLYRQLGQGMEGGPKVSSALRQAGIPGIRYLDQGSRGAGQGTSNFVIFPGEEELLRILERNGVPITSLLD